MKKLKFLFKEMAKYEPSMFLLIVLYSISIGLRPFIWIVSPAYILKNTDKPFSFFIIFFLILLIVSAISSFFDSFIMNNYRMKMNNIRYNCIRMVTRYSLYLPFDKQKDKIEIEKINNALKACQSPFDGVGGIMMSLPPIGALIFSISGFVWIFSKMGYLLLLLILVTTTIYFVINYKSTLVYTRYWEKMSPNWNIFTKLNYQLRSPESKQDILIYDFIRLFKSYYMKTNKDRISAYNDANKKAITIYALARLVSFIRDIAIFYWLITSILNGVIDIGDFYMFFTAIFAFITFNDEYTWIISNIKNGMASFGYFFDIMEENIDEEGEKLENLQKAEIEFRNVSFKYPNTDKYVLKDINFTIHDKESLALVGENGAGKSTLVLLLCGLYKPTSGEILLNGVNINKYGANYRDIVSAIFQDSLLLPFSIKENVSLDNNSSNIDDIYKTTGLDKIIQKYDKKDQQTLLRTLDEEGIDLSGGQKQRIFLSRALSKKTSKILILDESTAQLDALAERELYMLYDKLSEHMSSIFISHRLASTKFCDRVIFLKNGEIIGNDSHENLIKTNEEYKDLYEIQAKNYKEVL
ncbi:ABC transporter ATP-binding protein [Anaerococcus prevotii]|uniref:ABC transporter, ATP-binding protein n=1 Tax=Anaerococcus prevotii ACS-065-V-Col13 TaxID=879305 RepID=F0GWS3_9FIRM|nr:ABC transporter ATP-binding protein [Anaerococcus prevotii]EGC81651.1 ABC transporter, ATP-binding protein [Anaerococcus prevotii ACS-065-V-Col13]